MTAADLIHAVLRDRWRRNFVLPNYTPAGWWENDVFELTDAGYWREYEVKVTLADYKRDAGKRKEKWVARGTYRTDVKHELLAEGSERGPGRFWFVAPAGLIPLSELPGWAGLIEVTDRGPRHSRRWRYATAVMKDAPQLHKGKCPEKVVSHARGTCYWRMHGALATHESVDADHDYTI